MTSHFAVIYAAACQLINVYLYCLAHLNRIFDTSQFSRKSSIGLDLLLSFYALLIINMIKYLKLKCQSTKGIQSMTYLLTPGITQNH